LVRFSSAALTVAVHSALSPTAAGVYPATSSKAHKALYSC
jgi:hypothetical protein